jgi:septum site-determining protein MinD
MQQERSRMLGEMPMRRLVPTVSVPIMISMLVQALYNIVDSYFVAQYSNVALSAVNLAYPLQMLMIALSTGVGTGLKNLLPACDDGLIVVTPDDVAIRNAERLIGVMEEQGKGRPLLIVNRIRGDLVAKGLMYSPQVVANQLDVPLLGFIPDDGQVLASLNTHENFMDKNCPAAKAVERIARRFLGEAVPMPEVGVKKGLFRRKGGLSK